MNKKMDSFSSSNWKKLFFTIWGGQAFSIFGSSLVEFSLIWYLTDKTGSATVLSLNMMFMLLPYLLLSPFTGALVDRWNRRLVMIVSDSFIAVTTLFIMALFYLHVVQVWHIYLVIFLRSAAGFFHFTAMRASTSLMVPEEQLNRISGLNQALQGGMNIVAPPVGALMIQIFPMHQVLMVDVITAAIAILPLFFILIPQPENTSKEAFTMNTLFADIKDGIRYTRSWTGMVGLMVISLLVNFVFNPINALIPLVVKKHFGGGALELSWIEMAVGIGIVVGGITLSVWGGFKKRMLTVGLCLLITGACFTVMGMLPANAIWICVALIFVVGVALPFVDGLIFAIIQAKGSPEYQGRIMTLLTFSSKIMVPVSMLIAGPVADALGVLFWYRYGGIVIMLVALAAYISPSIMRVDEGLIGETFRSSEQAA